MQDEKLIEEIEAIVKERYDLEKRDEELKKLQLSKLECLLEDFTCPHCGAAYKDEDMWLRYDEYNDWQMQCTNHPCEYQTPRMETVKDMLEYMELSREYFAKKREITVGTGIEQKEKENANRN